MGSSILDGFFNPRWSSYSITRFPNHQIPSFPQCFKLWFGKKGPAEADPVFCNANDAYYLLSSTRDAIMPYEPALKKIRPRTRTVLAFTGVTFWLVPLTIETAMVD